VKEAVYSGDFVYEDKVESAGARADSLTALVRDDRPGSAQQDTECEYY